MKHVPHISICIPTYEMNGLGYKFLRHSFDVLVNQTYKDFEVVISDHSRDDAIKNVCTEYKDKLTIQYYRNHNNRGNSSANINNAIRHANGALIKILFQDDFLYGNNSLRDIVENFNIKKDNWMVTASEHTIDGAHFYRPFYPSYNDKIHTGKNTISSPSVLTIRNGNPLFFDENLIWLMDCDYYKRCYDTFGEPKILSSINVVNRVGPHQMSSGDITGKTLRGIEYVYVLKKHNEKELLKKYEERQHAKSVKLTPKVFVQKVIRRLKLYAKKTWTYLFLKRRYRYVLAYFFYNSIKAFYKRAQKTNKNKFLSNGIGENVLLIYSKNHFDPKFDNPQRRLSASSAANLARNIYRTLLDMGKKVTYVDQNEYIQKHKGQFDAIIGIVCKNYRKYAKNNPKAKKILFLVNSHPLYRLKALLKESKTHKKPIPPGEYVSPITFLRASKVSDKSIMIGNEFVKQSYESYGVYTDDIKLINSGVNTDYLSPKREFYFEDKVKIIFTASDMGIRKGLFRVIDVWNYINKLSNDNIELTIIGGNKSFSDDIERFAKTHDNVKNWGWVDSSDIIYKTLLQSSQIVINFSIEEGQVGCVLEAMACGCVPIITEESGIPIQNNENGILIKAGEFDAERVCRRIIDLVRNKKKMEKMSIKAREYIVKNHSWSTFNENFSQSI